MTHQVWTEKYRPKSLKTYIGDPKIISKVQQWIKSQNNYELDKPKILLLSGKPGTGKTTLAHIIFSENNYEIIELNASISRTKTYINNELSSIGKKSILSYISDSEPSRNGIIMDEIDGINDSEAINSIIKLVTQSPKSIQKSMSCSLEKRKKLYVKFPIICTCNSVKDRKLEKLIKNSLHITLSFPTEDNLLKLGKRIVARENINISSKKLKSLIKKNVKDYRDLINVLYMYNCNDNEISRNTVELENRMHYDDSISMKTQYLLNLIHKFYLDKKDGNIDTDTQRESFDNIIRFSSGIDEMLGFVFYNNLSKILNTLHINYKNVGKENFIKLLDNIFENFIIANQMRDYINVTQHWTLYSYPNLIGFIGNIMNFYETLDGYGKLNTKYDNNYYLEYYSDIHRINQNLSEHKKKLNSLEFKEDRGSDSTIIRKKGRTLKTTDSSDLQLKKQSYDIGINNISELYYMTDDEIQKYVNPQNVQFVKKIKNNIDDILLM